MDQSLNNIYSQIPEQLSEELFETLFKKKNLHLERIVSKGHITPPGQWFDQEWDEWILMLQGKATLLFEKKMELLTIRAGDYLLIPAHSKHRVEWTPADINTIWLAVHLR